MHYDLADHYRARPSAIHQLDPRAKVLTTLAFILALGLVPEGVWWVYGVALGWVVLVSWAAQLGPAFSLRRSFIALPFVLAAIFTPFTVPGTVLLRLPVVGWAVSAPGLVRFLSVLARSWLAVQAAVLLTATTRFPDLLWAFGALRFPRPLVSTIAFMYRYLFVLADEMLRMRRARAARSARRVGARRRPLSWQARMAGAMVGSLFLRALARSERVYAAMLSRGYDGHMRTLQRFRFQRRDWAALAGSGALLSLPLIARWLG